MSNYASSVLKSFLF